MFLLHLHTHRIVFRIIAQSRKYLSLCRISSMSSLMQPYRLSELLVVSNYRHAPSVNKQGIPIIHYHETESSFLDHTNRYAAGPLSYGRINHPQRHLGLQHFEANFPLRLFEKVDVRKLAHFVNISCFDNLFVVE